MEIKTQEGFEMAMAAALRFAQGQSEAVSHWKKAYLGLEARPTRVSTESLFRRMELDLLAADNRDLELALEQSEERHTGMRREIEQLTNTKDCLVKEMAKWEDLAKLRLKHVDQAQADLATAQEQRDAAIRKQVGAHSALVRELARSRRLERDLEDAEDLRLRETGKLVKERDALKTELAKAQDVIKGLQILKDPVSEWAPVSKPPFKPGVYQIKRVRSNGAPTMPLFSLWKNGQWHLTSGDQVIAAGQEDRSSDLYEEDDDKFYWREL